MKRNPNNLSAEDQSQMTSSLQYYGVAFVRYAEKFSEDNEEK